MAVLEYGHVGIFGRTRSGKSVLARHLYNKKWHHIRRDIYFNTQLTGGLTGHKVSSMSEFKASWRKQDKIVFQPARERVAAGEQLKELANYIFDFMGAVLGEEEPKKPAVRLFIDEVHNYGNAQKNVVDFVATQGLRYGIQLFYISQRPANVSNTILTQSSYFIFFNLLGIEKVYMERYSLPYQSIEAHVEIPYQHCIYDIGSDSLIKLKPVKY